MSTAKYKVLVTDRLIEDDEHAALKHERAILEPLGVELVNNYSSQESEIIAAGKGAIGLLVTYQKITATILESLPDLKIVVKCGIGYDNLDTKAAERLGIYTVNVPDYCDEEVASHALALIMDGLRAVAFSAHGIKAGRWLTDLEALALRRPSTLAVGTVGMGRIARTLHRYLAPLTGVRKYYDPYIAGQPGIERCASLEELFETCDVISLHLPLTAESDGMISADLLRRAKPGLVLVNTSRAAILNRGAVLNAIEDGRIGHFGTDLAWEEPLAIDDNENQRLMTNNHVSITPHMAWYSQQSEQELRRKAAMEVARVIMGHPPLNLVR